MAWRRPGDKPLSEPRMISLPTHICVTRPQWVKDIFFRLILQIGISHETIFMSVSPHSIDDTSKLAQVMAWCRQTINDTSTLVKIMAWHRRGGNPSPEPMVIMAYSAHFSDVIMSKIASQITSASMACSTVCSIKKNQPKTNGWTNSRIAGNLWRQDSHCDVMISKDIIWSAIENASAICICERNLESVLPSWHHQIGSINLTHYHIFPWLCAWDVCYIIFCHLLHIHSGKTGILFSSLLCILWWVQIFGYVLACRSCSFLYTLHYLIIIIVQTYLRTLNLQNACQICFVECVSKIKHIFSVIHYTIHHHQIGSMSYYPLFRVRSWNNGMRCMHLYILMSAVSADDLATGTMVTKPVSVYVRGTGYIQ